MASPSTNTVNSASPASAVAVLSSDSELLATTKRASSGLYDMLPVAAATDLATQLANGRAGATLIDSASVDEPIDAFAARLKQQFPDLVLVVAGGPEDQMRLSKLITDNVVYRFLHRPVSEQRIRLFLEAALRRHDSEHAEQSSGSATSAAPAAVAKAPANKLPIAWLAGGAALTILAIAGIWFASRSQSPPTPTATTTAPRDDAAGKITDLLVKADAAFARGALVAPRGDSAADHYRAALALAPGDARAQSGLEKVVGKLLSDAETALLAESIDTAESNVAAALGLDPSSTRAAFLAVQVRKERERGALARARENARATAGREQFQAFLRQANQRLRSGNLIEPAEDNARFYLEAARGLAPDDPAVARFSRSLQNAMLEQARAAAARGNASETELWIANADEAGASRTALADIRRSLQSTQVTAQAETMTRLTQAFARAAGAGQWIEPAGDNAKRYLLELRAADPTHPATTESRQRLGNELLREARIALGRSDLAAAERWLFHARDIEFTSAEVTATQRELDAARNRATGGATAATDARPRGVVAATTLERVQYSEPRFPAAAVTRGDSGWVDLEFTVRVDGSVTDVVATAAEPPGSFENSAISAVRRWRYRPVVVDGVAVEQRARLRIRFELQN